MSQFGSTGTDNTFALMRGGWLDKHSQFPFIGIIEEILLESLMGTTYSSTYFWGSGQINKWKFWTNEGDGKTRRQEEIGLETTHSIHIQGHSVAFFKYIILNTKAVCLFSPSELPVLALWGRKGAASGRPLKDTSTWPLLTVFSLLFWMRPLHPLQASPPICPSFLHLDCEHNF